MARLLERRICVLAAASLAVFGFVGSAISASYDDCLSLAGDPYDDRTWRAGTVFEEINGELAVQACEAAIQAQPNDGLILYWLFRAYLAEGLSNLQRDPKIGYKSQFADDEAIVRIIDTYIKIRDKSNDKESFEKAIFYLRENESTIDSSKFKYQIENREEFQKKWCKPKKLFCGSQMRRDIKLLKYINQDNYKYSLRHYVGFSRGYIPAVIKEIKGYCSTPRINMENNFARYSEGLDTTDIVNIALADYAANGQLETDKLVGKYQFKRCPIFKSDNWTLSLFEGADGKGPRHESYSEYISAIRSDMGIAPREMTSDDIQRKIEETSKESAVEALKDLIE